MDYTGNIRQVVAGHGEYGADANLHGNSADAGSGDWLDNLLRRHCVDY